MINKGKIKMPPNTTKGDHLVSTYSARDVSSDEDDADHLCMRITKNDITKRSVCTVCGGRGHYANVEGIVCATKQLGIKIPAEELSRTKYPDGITFPASAYVRPKEPVVSRDKATKTKIKRFRRQSEANDDARDAELAKQDASKHSESSSDDDNSSPQARMAVAFDNIVFA